MKKLGRVVVVTGGRDYQNDRVVNRVLSAYHRVHGIRLLVQGGARGADALAKQWAILNDVPHRTYKADWNGLGLSAGHIRNQQMLDAEAPHVVIAFPGGRGTADCQRRARRAGIQVLKVVS